MKIGLKRLLKLADILDTADAKHRQRKEPKYYQGDYTHSCGTPACALGHWAATNRRWVFMPLYGSLIPRLKTDSSNSSVGDAQSEFDLSFGEAEELFDGDGCGEAKTAKQAARYIRKFVKRKERQSLVNGDQ